MHDNEFSYGYSGLALLQSNLYIKQASLRVFVRRSQANIILAGIKAIKQ